jgi:hypothetical protein
MYFYSPNRGLPAHVWKMSFHRRDSYIPSWVCDNGWSYLKYISLVTLALLLLLSVDRTLVQTLPPCPFSYVYSIYSTPQSRRSVKLFDMQGHFLVWISAREGFFWLDVVALPLQDHPSSTVSPVSRIPSTSTSTWGPLRIGNADISCNIYEVIVIRALHPYSGAVIS